MKNIKFYVSKDVEEKILYKHGISVDELNSALEYGNPRIFNQGDGIYLAIMHHDKYITVVFRLDKNTRNVITAYPSSDSHIGKYNRK